MLKYIKNVITLSLCLLVIGGSIGVRFYIFKCNTHHKAQITLNNTNSCICHHKHDVVQHEEESCCDSHHCDVEHMFDAKDGVTSFNEACCCGSTSEVLSVSEFEVSQSDRKRITNVLQSFSSDFIVAPLNNLVCNVTSVVHYDIHPPLEKTSVLYRHQQLRL